MAIIRPASPWGVVTSFSPAAAMYVVLMVLIFSTHLNWSWPRICGKMYADRGIRNDLNMHHWGNIKEISWGRQALSALLTLCEGNIPVTCGFSSQNAKCQWLGPLVFALELAEQAVEQTVELRVICVKCPIFDITNNGVSTRKINIPESWLMVYKTYVTAVCTKFELRPTI